MTQSYGKYAIYNGWLERDFRDDAYKHKKRYDAANPQIDRIAVQGDAMNVAVCTDNDMIDEDINLFIDALSRDDEMLSERLHRLSAILKEIGY